ncbi:LOW QUALITY PROTEIN: malate dehydrogenase, mitochondrial [Aphomia sociella]
MRNIQVSIIGAANDVGAHLALLLKQNNKITTLNLYDDDEKVKGIGLELGHIPGGPIVSACAGDIFLPGAIRGANLILLVTRIPRKPGVTRDQMLAANAPAILKLCRVIADRNPDVFFAISTSPINSIVPFTSTLLYGYYSYNPFKIMGITHIDTARSRYFAADALRINPRHIQIPVIGGHSEETIVPFDLCQVDTLTRLVRKAGTEVIKNKFGCGSSAVALAWSINEFADNILDAINGGEAIVNCYSVNPHFGTRYFSGPTVIGPNGIIRTCCDFPMSDYESFVLNSSVPALNQDIELGENYVKVMEYTGR